MNTKGKRKPRELCKVVFRWGLLVGYMACIFTLSAIPGNFLPDVSAGDKLIHAGEFGLLAVLIYRVFGTHATTWPRARLALLSILGAILYGTTDEFHQIFVPQRATELADVVADSLGATLAVWGWLKATARWTWLQ